MAKELKQVIDALREELEQNGELLALLDQQRDQIFQRAADGLLKTVVAIKDQSAIVQEACLKRNKASIALADSLGMKGAESLTSLLQLLPEDYRVLIQTLQSEAEKASVRILAKARENHVLLCKSVEVMQTFLQSLPPCPTKLASIGLPHVKAKLEDMQPHANL